MSARSKTMFSPGAAVFALALGFGVSGLRTNESTRVNADDTPRGGRLAQNSSSESPIGSEHKADAASRRQWDLKKRSSKERRIEVALDESTEVDFTDNPLEEAFNYLEDLHHFEIWIDKQALQDEGINADTQITLVLHGASLRSTLKLILEPLALDYTIKHDVMVITTATKANKMFETLVYDVSQLKDINAAELEEMIYATVAPSAWDARSIEAIADSAILKTPATTGGGTAKAAPMHCAPAVSAPSPDAGEAANNGGGGNARSSERGSIRSTKSLLVIRQTRRIHEEVVDLLNQLEDSTN